MIISWWSICGSLFFVNQSEAMSMELYFYEDCEYCQIVLNTITNLKINDKLTYKDIRASPDLARELVELTGNETVPCLVNADGPMKGAKDIRKYLVSHFV